jgi:hypothetical protein
MSTMVGREITAEDLQQALSGALGPTYTVTATSGSTVKVKSNPLSWATVHMSWSGGGTSLRVSTGGFILGRAVNAMTITPKVRHALEQVFAEAA